MFCKKCGGQNPDTANFCSHCGAKLNADAKPTQTEQTTIDDPYWDDILPEIEEEIYSIPKENILKILGCAIGLFILVIWLIQ